MKTKTQFLFLFVLFLGISSCSKDDDNTNNPIEICNNGVDDDTDGQIDCDDGDCAEDENCVELDSDFGLKENFSLLNYGLNEVSQLDGKMYTYKSDKSSEKRIGFIAQEVQLVMPELVKMDKSNQHLKLKYMDMMAVLVNAVKEQQKTIEANRQRIEILICEVEKANALQ